MGWTLNRAQLAEALKKADAAATAGDAQAANDARRLAAAIQKLDAAPQMTPQQAANGAGFGPVNPMVAEAKALIANPVKPMTAPADPLAPTDPAERQRIYEKNQRAKGLIPLTTENGTEWVPDIGAAIRGESDRQRGQAAADKARAEYDAWRSQPWNSFRADVSDAVKGGLNKIEDAIFTPISTLQAKIDPNRELSKAITENVTPAAEKVGNTLGQMIEGVDGRFGNVLPQFGEALTGGLSEWTATMARNPRQGLAEASEVLVPTQAASRGLMNADEALQATIRGELGQAGKEMQEAAPDLAVVGMSLFPATSFGASMVRNAVKAPERAMAEQVARVRPLPAEGPVPAPSRAAQVAPGGNAPPPAVIDTPTPAAPRSRAEQRADDIFLKKLAADGLTMDDLVKIRNSLARRGDSGVYETSGELAMQSPKSSGANMRGLQMAGGAAPGKLQEALVKIVNENAAKLPDRLSRAATRATGQNAENAVATLDELDMRLRTEAGPAYDEAYATAVDPRVFANEILPVLNTPSGQEAIRAARDNLAAKAAELQGRAARGASERAMQEWERAKEAVKSIDDYLADPVRGTAIPTTMALDYTKRAFDDVIAKAGFGSDTARIVGGTKRSFADSVNQATGGKYGAALGVYEDIKRLEDAFDVGLGALSKKTWQLERELAKGRGGSPYSAGEVEAIAMGVARSIEDMIEAGDNRALTALTKDKALKNIATALGSEEAAAKFEQSVRRLAANRDWGRRVAGGSDTAMRQAAIRDAGMEGEDAVTRVLDRVESSGNTFSIPGLVNDVAVKPVARIAKDLYQRLRYPGVYDEGVNQALVPLIATPMTKGNLDEIIRRVEARLAEKGRGPRQPAQTNPSTRSRTTPGSTTNASATVTGAVVGGVGGAAVPEDDENQRFLNMLFGAGVGGTVGALAGKAAKRADKPPKPPGSPPAQMGFFGSAAPMRRPEPVDLPPQPAPPRADGKLVSMSDNGPGLKGRGGGGDGEPPNLDYFVGGLAGTATGGVAGLMAGGGDLDGDGQAGTANDQRLGVLAGLAGGAAGGLGITKLIRMHKAVDAARPSGMKVEQLARDVIAYKGFPDAIPAQQAVIDVLKAEGASAERIALAERTLAAIRRHEKAANDALAGRKPASTVTPLRGGDSPSPPKPPARNGIPGSMSSERAKEARGALWDYERADPKDLAAFLGMRRNATPDEIRAAAARQYAEAKRIGLAELNATNAANVADAANRIAALRAQGVDDRIIARSLGLEHDMLDEIIVQARRLTDKNGFAGSRLPMGEASKRARERGDDLAAQLGMSEEEAIALLTRYRSGAKITKSEDALLKRATWLDRVDGPFSRVDITSSEMGPFRAMLRGLPPEEGSSKLLVGLAKPGVAEVGSGVGTGALIAAAGPQDLNGDGTIDAEERARHQATIGLSAIATMTGVGAARSLGNRLRSGVARVPKGPPAQQGFIPGGGKGPPRPEVLPPDPYAGPPKKGTQGKAYRMGPEPIAEPAAPPRAKPKPLAKKMGRTEEVALKELKAAQRAYRRLDNKYVMKDDREKFVQPAFDRVVAAEQRLSKVRQTDARYRTFKARVGEVLNEPKMTLKGALIGSAVVAPVALAGIALGNALQAGKDPKAPLSPADPSYYWDRVVTRNRSAMQQVQGALQEWGFWDDEVVQNGNYGRTTKDAIKAWRYARGKDPEKPMTRADLKELLAGPKGYSGDGGEWGKKGEWYYGSGEMVRIPQ